jgi:4-aminobutyrate aminotransferase-like enzyme
MAAALASIDVSGAEGLLARGRMLGAAITARLLELRDRYGLLGEVRDPGLMSGAELVRSKKTMEPAREDVYAFVWVGLMHGGMLGESKYLGLGNIVRIKPPLVITDAYVERTPELFMAIARSLGR